MLQRGLRAEPHRRYPSMHELLRELRRGPVVALFRRVALVSVAAIGLAALLGYRDTLEQRRQCARDAATMVSGWDGHDHADPAARTIAGALEEW